MVKRTPAPRPLPSIVIVPPWKATTSWAMARPSPVASTVARARAVESGEALEDPVPLVRRDAGPVVGDAEHGVGLGLVQRDRDRRRRVPCRVVEQVAHRPHELIGVGLELRARHRARVDPVRGAAAQSARLGEDDLVEVDRVAMGGVERRRVGGREGEEVVDEPLQPHGVVEDVALGRLPVRPAPGARGRPRAARGCRSAGCAARGWRRRRNGAADRWRPRAVRASRSWCAPVGRSRPRCAGSGTRRWRSSAPIASTSRRIASTGRKARPVTTHVIDAHEQEQGRESEQRGGGSGSSCSRRPARGCRRRRRCTRPCS